MMDVSINQLLMVYLAYLVATITPGPSNIAILGVAMAQGRTAGMAMAAGVVLGSITWAWLAATGLSTLLASYAQALFVIKILGGAYLIYLAYRSARSALTPSKADIIAETATTTHWVLFRRGMLLHLTNPKAILAWMAIMSLGLGSGGTASVLGLIVGGCAILGVLVFFSYALIFSTAPIVARYQRARRFIEAGMAVFFGVAGLRLLMSRS